MKLPEIKFRTHTQPRAMEIASWLKDTFQGLGGSYMVYQYPERSVLPFEVVIKPSSEEVAILINLKWCSHNGNQ